jgi:hypothetical protein
VIADGIGLGVASEAEQFAAADRSLFSGFTSIMHSRPPLLCFGVRRWRPHRVTKRKRQLNPALEALVRELLEGDELVLSWSEFCPGEITIRLIRKELHRVCAPIAKKFGKEAGCGRILSFKMHDGQWVFHGVGGWIS